MASKGCMYALYLASRSSWHESGKIEAEETTTRLGIFQTLLLNRSYQLWIRLHSIPALGP
jgi:hypothetical protein